MYYEYFGLKHPPFKITPDTSLFYPGGNRGLILEALTYAVRNGEAIVKVTGEVGSGKTMLCRMLELELPSNIEIVYLANPHLSPDNILHVIAFELKLPVKEDDNRLVVMQALQEYLLQRHAENRQVVVFIEEAQGMPLATLEEIRLLTNLETNQDKLLQIVLFGQPELDDMLARPQIRQLKDRITYGFKLEPLNRQEIQDYLNARLRSCGYRGGGLFTRGAISLIAHYSQGLLRRVNILADKALLSAYADNARRAGRKQVLAAARDSELRPGWRHYTWPAAAALLISLTAVLGYQWLDDAPSLAWQDWMGVEETVPGSVSGPDGAVPVTAVPEVPKEMPEAHIAVDLEPIAAAYADPPVAEPAPPGELRMWVDDEPIAAVFVDEINDNGPTAVADEPADMPGPFEVRVLVDEPSAGDTAEMASMKRSLEVLPPEDIWLDAPATDSTCDLCTAIIYRPLYGADNM